MTGGWASFQIVDIISICISIISIISSIISSITISMITISFCLGLLLFVVL